MHSRKHRGLRVLTERQRPASPRRTRLFGGWLPLLAFYDPPCHRDGSPWNGREDPSFRITTLVLGWFGYGFSVTIGAVRPVPPHHPIRIEAHPGIIALDEQVRATRARNEEFD